MDDTRLHILVQGTADWHQPIATNQHYMVRELSRDFEVTFVESLGLRKPQVNLSDLSRITKRLTGAGTGRIEARRVPSNVRVVSPKVVPNHSSPWRQLNSLLLKRYLRDWSRAKTRVYWTYSPVTYGYEAVGHVAVYHCVDLYGSFPGIDAELIDREERRLAASGVVAIGSSEVVVDHLRKQGFARILYWPNVADTEEILKAVAHVEAQRSGAFFAGNLTEKKVDFDLLEKLVKSNVELHLAGPVAQGGGNSQKRVDDLIAAGALYHGMLSLPDLSRLMARCRVGLIPYLLTPYTTGVSPLKTYEYLAAGMSVVSTALPGVEESLPHVVVAADDRSFVEQTKREISASIVNQTERARIADAHSWIGRGKMARDTVRELIYGLPSSSS